MLSTEELREISRLASEETTRFMRESGNTPQSCHDRDHDAAIDALLEKGEQPEDYEISGRLFMSFVRGREIHITVTRTGS
jgi:hypothetical protein